MVVSHEGLKKMKSNTDKLEELVNSGKLTINRMIFRPKKMTGQEWYDRFTDSIYDIPETNWGNPTPLSEEKYGKNHAALWIPLDKAIEVARKVAGV